MNVCLTSNVNRYQSSTRACLSLLSLEPPETQSEVGTSTCGRTNSTTMRAAARASAPSDSR